MKLPITAYTTLVFDCDGVVLDSNWVKTEAFYRATLPYGEAPAKAMVDYHIANGGVSRYHKLTYFLAKIVPDHQGPDLGALLEAFAGHVRERLVDCAISPGLQALRQQAPRARWLIVSGGDQCELRDVFAQRGIAEWFDGGIFGSPDTKDEILQREYASSNVRPPALFLGDSKYDYLAARAAGLDFVFLSGWTEVSDWRTWVRQNGLSHTTSIQSLLDR